MMGNVQYAGTLFYLTMPVTLHSVRTAKRQSAQRSSVFRLVARLVHCAVAVIIRFSLNIHRKSAGNSFLGLAGPSNV